MVDSVGGGYACVAGAKEDGMGVGMCGMRWHTRTPRPRPLILHKVYVRCNAMLCPGRSAAHNSGANSLLTRLSTAMR